MWIRSQNKKGLVFVKKLIVVDKQIRSYSINNEEHDILGKYETEDRCITILDEIENAISNGKKVYNMSEK